MNTSATSTSPGSMRDRLIRRGLKLTHLRLLAVLSETGQIRAAATQLAMTQPAASRLLAELDTITGAKLYDRHPRGVVLTPFGLKLADWAGKIMRDLDAADREIGEMEAGRSGFVSIGSVTGPALDLVLPVLRQTRVTHPNIATNIFVDTSDKLADLLLSERLDFLVGRIPSDVDHGRFAARQIGPEPMSLIVRQDHPLIRTGSTALADYVDYDWVLQAPGGLLRTTVETYILSKGLPLPQRVFSTSSTLMTLAIISQSNAIAALSEAVADFFAKPDGLNARIATLPAAPDLAVSPYSLLRSRDRPLSPASQTIWDLVEDRLQASEDEAKLSGLQK
ncbi:LysR family transcriptional regulator [Tianweitania sp. BSSL-BM11]|uniref:LysR family transcriptional regulator n=1 Tax=Tianweitania aestuarii TaxID=2814886 RepID=A0ABS5RYR3_9HYPH|nr:LysR family transcriptional regulator [Tianweitania aestuarii]MBS9722158.1 LysR family transcriptional regulator [Tianweitania aestuarii]